MDNVILDKIYEHRCKVANMVAKTHVRTVPYNSVGVSALALAEEVVAARKRRVRYHVRDQEVLATISDELRDCGYDVKYALSLIR